MEQAGGHPMGNAVQWRRMSHGEEIPGIRGPAYFLAEAVKARVQRRRKSSGSIIASCTVKLRFH